MSTHTDNDLHVALDVLARRPFDGMVILDAAEADALQQLIVDMHAAHERTEHKASVLMEHNRMFMRHNTQLMKNAEWYMRKNRELATMVVDRRRT